MKLLHTALLVALATGLLLAPEPLLLVFASCIVLYVYLLSGFLVIPPAHESPPRKKVFCIGLSRTGTTSITVALYELGYAAHHQCHALVTHDENGSPRASSFWAEAFDAHADIAPATVFEELSRKYPDARFVMTRREPHKWARAMVRFVAKFHRLLTTPPIARMFEDVYGRGWASFSEAQWVEVYKAHEERVDACFQRTPERLLKLDICHGAGWAELCGFLGEPTPPSNVAFPHADVFALSAGRQVWWQLRRLRARFGRILGVTSVLVFALRPAVYDHGQCARACRVANAMTGAPGVLGATGHWFAPGVSGRRLWSDPGTCQCYSTVGDGKGSPLRRPAVPRLHPPIETRDQYQFRTSRVCGADAVEYASAAAAHRAGVDVANCGQCSRCSSLLAVDAMHARATSLTVRASIAAVVYLVAGESVHWYLMRSGLIGFPPECADCWLAATQCNVASCGKHCLYGWNNPLSASSTITNTTVLNACMQCDELHCSAYFLQACGANRRTAGVVTDIQRPSRHVCQAARHDALKRANAPPATMTAHTAMRQPSPLADDAAREREAMATWLLSVIIALLLLALMATRLLLGPRSRPLPRGHYRQQRRLLLTGCASGMGRRLTGTLLRRGHAVLATDVDEQALRAASAAETWEALVTTPGQLLLCPLDVREPASWEASFAAILAAWGGFDTLVNFAGLLVPAGALDITTRQVDAHVDVMVKGVMHGTVGAARVFRTQTRAAHDGHGGHIVNVSSLGAVAPVAGVSLYQAAKAAARTFSLAAAKDLRGHGVHVSVLMPDAVQTPMAELQLLHDESAMAYSGGILTLAQLEACLLDYVLPARPMEKRLGATLVRQWGASFADNFPSSLAVAWTESGMRKAGRAAQARECARRLAAGGLSAEQAQTLTDRLEQLTSRRRREKTAAADARPRSMPSLLTPYLTRGRLLVAAVMAYLLVLRFATSAGPSDLAKATLGVPSHPPAAEMAVGFAGQQVRNSGHGGQTFHGRLAMVTGATSGVGLETAGALAEAGFHVLIAARSQARAKHAVADVEARARRRGLGGSAEAVLMDLADVASVRRAARRVIGPRALHLLVCSAGVMPSPLSGEYSVTADGVELVWGVNHLAHVALAEQLRPALRRGVKEGFASRLVVVTSEHGHRHFAPTGGLPPVLPPGPYGWDPFTAYGISKLSNVMHAREAARRWAADGIAAHAVHPGIVPTALGQMRVSAEESSSSAAASFHNAGVWLWWRVIARPLAERIEYGSASVVFAALSPTLLGTRFAYIRHCREAQPSAAALDDAASARLWRESQRILDTLPMRAMGHEAQTPPSRDASSSSQSGLWRLLHDYCEAFSRHLRGCVLAYGLASAIFLGPWAAPDSGTWLGRFKFDASSRPDWRTVRYEALYCCLSIAVLSGYDVVLRCHLRLIRTDAAGPTSAPGLAAMIVAAVFVGDSHFYWMHRLLHAVPLLRRVHAVHHSSISPEPLAGLCFHPIESLLYFSSLAVCAVLLPLTPRVYSIYKWALMLSPISTHCGYGPRLNSVFGRNMLLEHFTHHRIGTCNFGGLLPWDRWCGTGQGVLVRSKE